MQVTQPICILYQKLQNFNDKQSTRRSAGECSVLFAKKNMTLHEPKIEG